MNSAFNHLFLDQASIFEIKGDYHSGCPETTLQIITQHYIVANPSSGEHEKAISYLQLALPLAEDSMKQSCVVTVT